MKSSKNAVENLQPSLLQFYFKSRLRKEIEDFGVIQEATEVCFILGLCGQIPGEQMTKFPYLRSCMIHVFSVHST